MIPRKTTKAKGTHASATPQKNLFRLSAFVAVSMAAGAHEIYETSEITSAECSVCILACFFGSQPDRNSLASPQHGHLHRHSSGHIAKQPMQIIDPFHRLCAESNDEIAIPQARP